MTVNARFKYYDCPICGKTLIRLDGFNDDDFHYFCDECGVDITVEVIGRKVYTIIEMVEDLDEEVTTD